MGVLLTVAFSLMISMAFNWNILAVAAIMTVLSFLLPNHAGIARAIVSNPLIGRAKQSMGGATFTSWKGKNVLKNKATSVANPKTDKQLQQRDAFSQMVAAFRQAPGAIKAGFKKQAVGMSEFNAFMKYNVPSAFDMSAPPAATFDPALASTGKGTINPVAITTAIVDKSDLTATVTFPPAASQPGQSASDLAIITAYNITKEDWTGGVTTDLRSSGTAQIAIPGEWEVGDETYVYLSFKNELSAESSDSTYETATIQA